MRGVIAVGLTTFALFQGSALAGVSDDLVFCSKLTSPRERISCYDAAARIAANNSGVTRSTPSAIVSVPVAGNPLPYKAPPPDKTPFHGAYVSVGGSYAVGAPVNLTTFDQIQIFNANEAPHGPSVVGSLGYNIQFGHFVTGLELSGRYGREGYSQSAFASVNNGQFGIIGTSLASVSYNVDTSIHAAIRTGLALGNTLAFVKAGLGVAHLNQITRSDLSATRCDVTVFVGGAFVCTLRSPLPSIVNETHTWLPSLLFGLGIEHNFGPIFARVEAEAEAISRLNQNNGDWFWSARAMASVGLRF